MKKIIFFLFLLAQSVFSAETNVVTVLTTNYVAAAPNFREVNGQLYNVDKSVKFETKDCYFTEQYDEGALMAEITKVVDHVGRSAIDVPGTPAYRPFYKDAPGQKFLVRNFSTTNAIVSGDTIEIRVMRVGQTNFNSEILPLYDFGKPHVGIVVTARTVKAP
jgi:hypothetical protein